ncbi:MAG: hypothetical protein ACYDAG_17350 [Chloroflexota bacterium]
MADPLPYPDAGDPDRRLDREARPGMPRWVKVFGIAFLVLVLLIAIMMASGHGPGNHMPGAGLGGRTSPASLTAQAVDRP